jgi:hypothetical protein
LVHYQYGQIPLLVLTIKDARTGIGVFALWISISMGTFHYWSWHSIMPVPVLAFLHFSSVPVWAWTFTQTGTGIFAVDSVPVWADSITGTDNQ